MQYYTFLLISVFIGTSVLAEGTGRVYTNPLNGKAVDVFFVVDESMPFITVDSHKDLMNMLSEIAVNLNPPGSTPYFGVFFYGVTTQVNQTVPFPTTAAAAVKSRLDSKQFPSNEANPSSVSSALTKVELSCRTSCRALVPRVIVWIAKTLDPMALALIRRMEDDLLMTVIIAGVGHGVNSSLLNQLASYPASLNAIPVDDFSHLLYLSLRLPLLISDIPRPHILGNQLSVPGMIVGQYYTLFLDIGKDTIYQDMMISFTSNCYNCRVFASLTQPSPNVRNTFATPVSHWNYLTVTNPVYYFMIPKNSRRFFFSIEATTNIALSAQFHLFTPPQMMERATESVSGQSLVASMG